MKSWRGVQSVKKTGNGGGRVAGERGYGVWWWPCGGGEGLMIFSDLVFKKQNNLEPVNVFVLFNIM